MQIIRIGELVAMLGISRATIYNKLNKSSRQYDKTFPKRIKLGASAVGWLKADVDSWLAERIKMSGAHPSKGDCHHDA